LTFSTAHQKSSRGKAAPDSPPLVPAKKTAAGLRRFFAANRIEWGDLLIADLNGVFRGKRLRAADFAAAVDGNLCWPASVFAISIDGRCVEETGVGARVGDPDYPARIAPDSVALAPWRNPPGAQGLLEILNPQKNDGALFFADPKAVLRRVIKRFTKAGLTPVLAAELEFYLYAPGNPPAFAEPAPRLYALDKIEAFDDFLRRCFAAAHAQGVAADSVIGEYAPGQFEINLSHRPDAERAATDALLLRRLVRECARADNLRATFLSKPFAGASGSGLHFHLSILDKRGRNIFSSSASSSSSSSSTSGGEPSKRFYAAIAGALKIIGEGFAFFAPFANSYRRFVPDSYAPLAADWDWESRNAALRLPRAADVMSRRLEFRLPGADANPYLAAAALLAGVHYGMEKQLAPPPRGKAKTGGANSFPMTWRAALDNLAAAKILPDYLGADFIRFYLAVKESEWRHHRAHISDYDRTHYMSAV
jgi:glutamine synthetase